MCETVFNLINLEWWSPGRCDAM